MEDKTTPAATIEAVFKFLFIRDLQFRPIPVLSPCGERGAVVWSAARTVKRQKNRPVGYFEPPMAMGRPHHDSLLGQRLEHVPDFPPRHGIA